MARFGLADDSDEDEPVQSFETSKSPVAESSKGKGKAVVTSPPIEEDIFTGSPHFRPQLPTTDVPLEGDEGDGEPHESSSSEHDESSGDEDDSNEREEQPKQVKPPVPWASKIGMEPHKVHVMQASFFRAPEEAAAVKAAAERATVAGRTTVQQQAERLLNASAKLAKKHARSPEAGRDHFPSDTGQRPSFDHSLDFMPHRSVKKFARVEGAKSVSAGNEGSYVDAGLAFGRSFRVSWGPGGQLARVGAAVKGSLVHIDTIRLVADNEDVERVRSTRLLQVHLQHSNFDVDESSIPFASPSSSLTFSTFASLFPPHDNTHEAQVWRQGVALFDPLESRLPSPAFIPPLIKPQLSAIRRHAALSEWLASTVGQSVTAILRSEPSSSSAQRTFVRLTGHQVEEAVNEAITNGNVRLATLLSQAGCDDDFHADLEDQLAIWRAEGADQFVDEAYRKCLALLAGITDIWKSSNRDSRHEIGDVNVVKGLDWKRAFGLALWYGQGSEGGGNYERAVEQYERSKGEKDVAPPLPWYKEDPVSASGFAWNGYKSVPASENLGNTEEADALFELLRLSMAAIPLEKAIYPRAFGPSPLDYRMTWHVYMLLSRAMRLKDFSDRQLPNISPFEAQEGGVEEHSETADRITCAYASQLEALGQVQEAAFVLLHLEGSNGRKAAIKELLVRQAHALEEWQIMGLTSLRIPMEWVEEAQACLAQYKGNTFDAYEHFLRADEQRLAHDIAVNELAPDAVIREDLSLIRALFKPFNPQLVDDWSFRGKLFVDYADAAQRIPELVASREDVPLDATDAIELERFKVLAPQLIRLLPDVFRDRTDPRQNAALSEMLSALLLRFDSIKGQAGPQPSIESGLVDEATRLRHIHTTAYNRFLHSLSALA